MSCWKRYAKFYLYKVWDLRPLRPLRRYLQWMLWRLTENIHWNISFHFNSKWWTPEKHRTYHDVIMHHVHWYWHCNGTIPTWILSTYEGVHWGSSGCQGLTIRMEGDSGEMEQSSCRTLWRSRWWVMWQNSVPHLLFYCLRFHDSWQGKFSINAGTDVLEMVLQLEKQIDFGPTRRILYLPWIVTSLACCEGIFIIFLYQCVKFRYISEEKLWTSSHSSPSPCDTVTVTDRRLPAPICIKLNVCTLLHVTTLNKRG